MLRSTSEIDSQTPMEGSEVPDSEAQVSVCTVPSMVLSVMNLKYTPSQNIIAAALQSDEAAVLENVTFSVNSGELMGVLAPNDAERR